MVRGSLGLTVLPGSQRSQPGPPAHLHFLSDVFRLHELPGESSVFTGEGEIFRQKICFFPSGQLLLIIPRAEPSQASNRIYQTTFPGDREDNGATNGIVSTLFIFSAEYPPVQMLLFFPSFSV